MAAVESTGLSPGLIATICFKKSIFSVMHLLAIRRAKLPPIENPTIYAGLPFSMAAACLTELKTSSKMIAKKTPSLR